MSEMKTLSGEFEAFVDERALQDTIVILGSQGSGTNLLVRILIDVFGIHPVLDRSLIFDAAARLGDAPSPSRIQQEIDFVCDRLCPSPARKRVSLKHYHRLAGRFSGVREALQHTEISSTKQFTNFFYSYSDFISNSKCKAIKSDDIWERLGMLPGLIDRPRFILLVRDPRDTAFSITNKNFGPRNLFVASKYIEKRMSIYRDFFQQHAGAGDLRVRYEDLLTCPEAFCESFQESFGLEPLGPLDECITASKIRRKNSEKWRRLPAKALARCEHVLSRHIEDNGYELSGNAMQASGRFVQAGFHMADITCRVPQKLGRVAASLRGR